nr:MAG TPA: hypothetical protein [Caudoviricetes sp.]
MSLDNVYLPNPKLLGSYSVLNQFFVLEPILVDNQIKPLPGIYNRYKYRPVITPGKEYFLINHGNDKYVTYDDLYKNLEKYQNEKWQAVQSFDSGEMISLMRDLSVLPFHPIRSHLCIKTIIEDLIKNTRCFNGNTDYLLDDAIEAYINDQLSTTTRDMSSSYYHVFIDKLSTYIYSSFMGILEDMTVIIKQNPWEIMSVEGEDGVICLLGHGDYRIHDWMKRYQGEV